MYLNSFYFSVSFTLQRIKDFCLKVSILFSHYISDLHWHLWLACSAYTQVIIECFWNTWTASWLVRKKRESSVCIQLQVPVRYSMIWKSGYVFLPQNLSLVPRLMFNIGFCLTWWKQMFVSKIELVNSVIQSLMVEAHEITFISLLNLGHYILHREMFRTLPPGLLPPPHCFLIWNSNRLC